MKNSFGVKSISALNWLFSRLIFAGRLCHANLQTQSPQALQIGFAGFLDPSVRRDDSRLVEKAGQAKTNRKQTYGLYSCFLRLGSPGGLNTTSNLLVQSNYDDGETYQQARRELMQNVQSMSQAIESSVNIAGRTGSDPVGTINGAGFALQGFSNRLDQRDPGAAASFGEFLGQSLVAMGGVGAGAARVGSQRILYD
jgi:hypothetical protein